jgi:hypothetical protein
MNFDERLDDFERRLSILEDGHGLNGKTGDKTIKLDLTLPEADIGGLRFNKTEVHAVFEKKEDGNYYSRDILFHSARDTDEGTGRDLLSEYLDSDAVREAFLSAIGGSIAHTSGIRVFIPEENQGIKKYNGVSWWYWLRTRCAGSAAYFCGSGTVGHTGTHHASAVGGCAPAFCVGKEVTP